MTSKGVEALIQKDAATYADYFNAIRGAKMASAKKLVTDPFSDNNLITVQALGVVQRWRLPLVYNLRLL